MNTFLKFIKKKLFIIVFDNIKGFVVNFLYFIELAHIVTHNYTINKEKSN